MAGRKEDKNDFPGIAGRGRIMETNENLRRNQATNQNKEQHT